MNTTTTQYTLPRLYGDDFAAQPEAAYETLRTAGPIAWAELAPHVRALVVTSHRAAIDLLNDTDTYSKDARRWHALTSGHIPPNSPVLAMMAWRPSLLYADGAEHARLRTTIDACMTRISPHRLTETTRNATLHLLAKVEPAGRADLLSDVADTVPLLVFADLLGCPPDLTGRLVDSLHGLIEADERAAQASADLAAMLTDLIDLKGRHPGENLTSWLLQHPANLSVDEIVNQLILVIGAGTVPTSAWIVHAMRLLLDGDAYAGSLTHGTLTVNRAMEKALWTASPMANFSIHYARHETVLHGVRIPPGVPILISHAAANHDPALPDGLDYSNRSHLSWSVGPHRCPATSQATVIVRTAIETLWDRLWDMEADLPADQIPNRHGPFHQCPASLPVAFAPKTSQHTATGGAA